MKRSASILVAGLLATTPAPALAKASSPAATQAARECSADALPAAERRAMEERFRQIERRQGREAAMTYAREQGRLFSERLIAEGVCTPDGRTRAQASAETRPGTRPEARSDRRERQGSNCRVETRPVAGFGGAPMTMGMVTVCD